MLTFVEALSLAGDRLKQNDDALGFTETRAWVLDGATDLDDRPLMGGASDAAWIAHNANASLHSAAGDLRSAIRVASANAAAAFDARVGTQALQRWQRPIASLLILEETHTGVAGMDLGDCRVFAVDAEGAVHSLGGPEGAADDESAAAAQQTDSDKPLLQRTATIAKLRQSRAALNAPNGRWTFGLDRACADHARAWRIELSRPAHVLLMTDGFAALADRYRAYDARALVRAAVEVGLQELGRELRAIEHRDAAGAMHPRFKKSDDATALLMRMT